MLSLKIALRYLLSRKSHGAVNVISAISVAGVAVATAAVIVVLSVFNGFATLARAQFDHIDPDLLAQPVRGKTFPAADSLAAAVAAIDGVSAVAAVITEHALAVTDDARCGVTVIGATSDLRRVIDTDAVIVEGAMLDALPPSPYRDSSQDAPATVAIGVMAQLGGSPAAITLYAPRRRGRINPANPAAALCRTTIVPTAMMRTDRMEYDADHIIVPIDAARQLLGYDDNTAGALYISLDPSAEATATARRVADTLGSTFNVLDRDMQQQESFRMIAIEKWVTFMMLIFIIVIAAFNIISTLSLMVIEKRDNMTTLRHLGASRALVRRIFMIQGAIITIAGGAGGIIGGIILVLVQQWGGVIRLAGDPATMTVATYPVRLHAADIMAVAALIIFIAAATAQVTRLFTRKIQ